MSSTNGTIQQHAVTKLPAQGTPCSCGKPIPDAVRDQILNQGKARTCSCGIRYWTRDWSPDAGVHAGQGFGPVANEIAGPVRAIVEASAKRAAESNARHLGTIVRVTCPKEVPSISFADAFVAAGFHEADQDGIQARGALGRACRVAKHGTGLQEICEASDATSVVYALTESVSVGLERKDAQKVTYSPATRQLSFATETLRVEIEAGFAKYQTVLQRDKTNGSVRNAFGRVGGVPCLGGYFLPADQGEAIESARKLVSALKAFGDARFEAVEFHETPQNKTTVAVAAADHFAVELAALEAALAEDVRAASAGERKVRASTFASRQSAALVLKERALAYKETVELDASDLEARVAALVAKVGELAENVSA